MHIKYKFYGPIFANLPFSNVIEIPDGAVLLDLLQKLSARYIQLRPILFETTSTMGLQLKLKKGFSYRVNNAAIDSIYVRLNDEDAVSILQDIIGG